MTRITNLRRVALGSLLLLTLGNTAPRAILVLPVGFTDTSGESEDQSAAHARRLASVASALALAVREGNGTQPALLDQATLDRACPGAASDCVLALARGRGATHVLLIQVFKTSTLILEARADLVEVATNIGAWRKFVGFRGDNDDSWRRLGRFLGRQLVDADPKPQPPTK